MLLTLLVAGPAECRKGIIDVRLTLADARTHEPGGAEEIGNFEAKRLAGRFTRGDSARWLNEMKSGREIIWAGPDTRSVEFILRAPDTSDPVRTWIHGTYGLVREQLSIMAKRGRYRFLWKLDDDAGGRVEPGVYCAYFVRRETATPFYIVVQHEVSK